MNARDTLLCELIDYAGLFPPASLSMAQSIAEYRQARGSVFDWILGRFICPASRLADLQADTSMFPLSVILDTPSDARAWFNAVRSAVESLESLAPSCLELRLPVPIAMRETFEPNVAQLSALLSNAGLHDVPAFVEFPRCARWSELLNGGIRSLSRSKMGAKIRCGGVTEDAFPTCDEVARFIAACKEHAVPFKATAGLHHPVRHRDPGSGFLMHGFLNVLGAAVFAESSDFAHAQLVEILAEEDAGAFSLAEDEFAWRGCRAGCSAISRARNALFTAYGSCSFTEPINDLQSLGMLTAGNALT